MKFLLVVPLKHCPCMCLSLHRQFQRGTLFFSFRVCGRVNEGEKRRKQRDIGKKKSVRYPGQRAHNVSNICKPMNCYVVIYNRLGISRKMISSFFRFFSFFWSISFNFSVHSFFSSFYSRIVSFFYYLIICSVSNELF